jgi:hypothetical protein
MSAARVELTWSPDDRRQRVRRSAAMTVIVLAALLWTLSRAETPATGKTTTTATTATSIVTTTRTDTATSTTATTTTVTATTETTTTQPPPAVPTLAVTAPSVDFGEQPVGGAVKREIGFRNDGNVLFTPAAIAFDGARAASFEVDLGNCGGGIAPGTGCAAVAVFRPGEARDEKAQVVLLDRSGARSAAVQLFGRGTAPLPPQPPPWHHVVFDSSLVEVPQGTTTKAIIRNDGEDEATIGWVAVESDGSFAVDPADCQPNRKLAPRDTCTFLVIAARDRGVSVGNLRLFNAAKRLEDVAAVINVVVRRNPRPVETKQPLLKVPDILIPQKKQTKP